uniref:Uncharacterized protein n=1 Tax=Sphaerodactylus townsendi TaxID=933632 RepID=A0ACB8EVH7_9SAUR
MKDKVMDKPMEVVEDGSQVIPNPIIPGRKPAGQLDPRGKPPSEGPAEAAVNSPDLTEEPVLNLIDAGLAINSAYPLILYPERNIKLILSFDFSSGDPFESRVNSPDLTEEPVLNLIDAGLAINSAYPLILYPERNVKLILSFDFSSEDPFETLKKTVDYCQKNRIPFPKINEEELKDTENPSDCYIFRGDNGLTVMHFPQFNRVNCAGNF